MDVNVCWVPGPCSAVAVICTVPARTDGNLQLWVTMRPPVVTVFHVGTTSVAAVNPCAQNLAVVAQLRVGSCSKVADSVGVTVGGECQREHNDQRITSDLHDVSANFTQVA